MDYASAWPAPHAAAVAAPQPPPEHHHLHNPYAPPPPSSENHLPHHQHHYAASAAPPNPPNPSAAAASYQPSSSFSSYCPNPSPPAAAAAAAAAARHDPYAAYPYAPAAAGGGGLAYYYGVGGGGGEAAAFVGKEAVRQYGFDPQLYAQAVAARSSNGIAPPVPAPGMQHGQWNAHYGHPPPRNAMKKRMKKTRVVQSAFCEVCKIDCNTPDVLKSHKQGKKHKKNLEKLQEAITAKPVKPPTNTAAENKESSAADKGKVVAERSKKKSAIATPEELEVKKRRVLEAGAAEGEVRICTVCNVVVNNQKVYEFHIAGQKHLAMVQKQQERQGGARGENQVC